MNIALALSRLAYKIFGPIIDPLIGSSASLRASIRKANIRITVGEYFSYAALITAIIMPLMMLAVAMFLSLLGKERLAITLAMALTSILTPIFMFAFFYIYPSFMADSRKRAIDSKLPFAVPYMAAMAGAGVPPDAVFDSLARSELYGEIAEEAKNITRDCRFFGKDIVTVLHDYTQHTPSRRFSELLMGITTTVRSGGDLKMYLHNEAENMMVEYRQMMKDFAENLGLFAESYITIPVFGTIFLVIVMSTLTMISGGDFGPLSMQDMMMLVVYLGIPGLSVLFLLMIDSIIPEE
ncbi:MAG: type II secretion system F family protein [Theionarchaea archaeon]|nr:type II secretion system F family protein [Theionarchaea archaeon]MBU7039094.1 type II secretion system F family protein [Theionarchaea archaeon]